MIKDYFVIMEALGGIDQNLYILINQNLSNGLLDIILIPLRHKLCSIPLYLFIASFIILHWKNKAWLVFLSIGVLIGLSDSISSQLIKKTIKRERPCHQAELTPVKRIPCTNGYSFTSSHATNHMAQAMFYFLIFPFFRWRWLFFLWAGLISLAQVYVGVHYPSDVLAGMTIGAIIGWMIFMAYHWISLSLRAHQT